MCTLTLELTYTNQTEARVFLELCYPDDLSPIYGISGLMREEVAYNPVWACVGHDTFIEVLPGETRADTLTLWGPNAFDDKTGEPFGVLEGRMQIGYQAKSCADQFDPCELPQEAKTSNVFTVTLPD